jgi:hypothetical protein
MGKRAVPDRPCAFSDLPEVLVVEIAELPEPGVRAARERIAAIQITRRRGMLALALLVAVLGAAVAQLPGGRVGERRGVSASAHESGPAGVAAAYGYPLRCLSVTILATDRTYARADFNHMSACGRYTWYPTAIFHRVAGAWRPVLDAVNYRCPLDSVPAAVQTRLGVCATTRG